MNHIKLCSGVDFHIIDAPKFKTNLMSIYFNFPLERSNITRAALLPSVLKRGSEDYPTLKDMSRRLDDLYSASMSAGLRMKGDGVSLFFSSEYISDKYIPENLSLQIAEFLKSFILSPLTENGGFLTRYVDSEKVNLRNTILGLINDKKEYTEFKCREAMFGEEGYGISEIGYEEDLDEITPMNLYEFYKWVIENAKIDIFVSGSVDVATAEQLKSAFTAYFSPRSAEYVQTAVAQTEGVEVSTVVEDADVTQSKLCIGVRCGVEPLSDEYYALMLGSCIFGGSPFSKLFNNVREKLSLAYYAFAKTSRFKSVMMISSGIQTENFQAAYDEIMLQFKKMQDGEIDGFEIEASKKYLSNSFGVMKDNLRVMEDYYYSQVIMGFEQSPEQLSAELNKVTVERVAAVMNKLKFDKVYFLKGRLSEEAKI